MSVSHRSNDGLPRFPPKTKFQHAEALWILAELGFRGTASQRTFYEYIKSLRKLGAPFPRGTIGVARRGLANYAYNHLMELALALTLRVYHVVPDAVLTRLTRHRRILHRHYRLAYEERCAGLGSPVTVHADGREPIRMQGVFLDLQIDFSGGRLVHFGPQGCSPLLKR